MDWRLPDISLDWGVDTGKSYSHPIFAVLQLKEEYFYFPSKYKGDYNSIFRD